MTPAYRKKPVNVYAIQWDETETTMNQLESIGVRFAGWWSHQDKPDLRSQATIYTSGASKSIRKGEWIVKPVAEDPLIVTEIEFLSAYERDPGWESWFRFVFPSVIGEAATPEAIREALTKAWDALELSVRSNQTAKTEQPAPR